MVFVFFFLLDHWKIRKEKDKQYQKEKREKETAKEKRERQIRDNEYQYQKKKPIRGTIIKPYKQPLVDPTLWDLREAHLEQIGRPEKNPIVENYKEKKRLESLPQTRGVYNYVCDAVQKHIKREGDWNWIHDKNTKQEIRGKYFSKTKNFLGL